MSYSIQDLLVGAQVFSKSVFGQKKEYTLQFNHEEDGLWYVDFPNWPFDHHNLLMVNGADELCAFLSDDDKRTYVNVIPANKEEEHPGYAKLVQKEHSLTGGSTYEVTGLEGFGRDIWLCPVTLFVLGQYPKFMYVKKAAPQTALTDEVTDATESEPAENEPIESATADNADEGNKAQKTHIYHLIVLDESGSMDCVRRQTVTGCNETIQSVRTMQEANPDTQEHFVSIYVFNSGSSRYMVHNRPIGEVEELSANDYQPNNCTPLFDALGLTLSAMRELMKRPGSLGYVTIITDGLENASHEYSLDAVRSLIGMLKENNVIFTFVGANIDADAYAKKLDIANSMQFVQDDEGMKEMWDKENRSKMRSMARMSLRKEVDDAFDMKAFAVDYNRAGYYDEHIDERRVTDERIATLGPDEVRVCGARRGQAEGRQGNRYAIPVEGVDKRQLNESIARFCTYAAQHPELTFLVSMRGCEGLGWRVYDIAPMFQEAVQLDNVKLPRAFWDFIA